MPESAPIDDVLSKVLARFPESRATIMKHFSEDEEFRGLCEDYAECILVIARLLREAGGDNGLVEQYCEMRLGLETELHSKINPRQEN